MMYGNSIGTKAQARGEGVEMESKNGVQLVTTTEKATGFLEDDRKGKQKKLVMQPRTKRGRKIATKRGRRKKREITISFRNNYQGALLKFTA